MTYSSTLRAKLDNTRDRFPKQKSLSVDILDRIAESEYQKRLYGSYTKQDPTCKICFVKISKNGSCNC